MDLQAAEKFKSFRPSWQSFGVYIFGAAVLGIGPELNPNTIISPAVGQLLATLFVAFILIKRMTNLYQVSPDGVLAATSFPKNHVEVIKMRDIKRIDLRRAISQRALGVAHVHIYVEGQDGPTMKLFGVTEPAKFKQLLLDYGASDTPVYGAFRK